MKSPPLCFEFGRNTLRVLHENHGAEFPLERAPDGRLNAAGRDRLVAALTHLQKSNNWPAHSPAYCAIDARGVSLRCLMLPSVASSGLYQVVRLQIESEFPLPPDELSWGYQPLGEPKRQADGGLKQAVLVAAVKRGVVEDYSAVLTALGLTPEFTPAALARPALCPSPPGTHAVLELGAEASELSGFANDSAAFLRVLPQGTLALAQSGEHALAALAKAVRSAVRSGKLYVFGDADLAARLGRLLANGIVCEHVPISPGEGLSSAILGLTKCAQEPGCLPLTLQWQAPARPKKFAEPALVEWGVRAVFLLLAVLLFPSLEALLLTAPLSEKVEAFQIKAGRLENTVDRELDFLRNLKASQPPYLESFYVISQAAPQGIHIESLTMNRRGEVALRGSLRNGDQVADFRSKLIGSGFFASVTVEEQSPTPDHQKVNIRMTAQWKPTAQLQALAIGPAEPGNATNAFAGSHATPPNPMNGGAN